jgi:transcriptional regulator with PAS, ATPase and Fis domain
MPSRDTTSAGRGRPVLAIRWVFPESQGRLSRLGRDTILLGRDDDCAIRLPGDETSRRHAEIRRDGPLHIVRDLGSRNGVFVDGERIDEAPLAPGKVLRLGEWIGIVVQVPADLAEPSPVFGEFAEGLAGGPALRPILDQAKVAAPAALPTVILGETGTGKEGVARAMHAWSGRTGPFVAVNCATLVPTLAEAELFGYRKGAFTGADRASPGFFRAAQDGTLLLDEVTDLPESVQAKLLRAIEQREIVPLGESTPVSIDVRVLAATQIPLGQVVGERRFRADLCARLEGMTIRLPPLRERREEIPFLFLHLLRLHAGGLSPAVEPRLVERLCLHDWPFNVREMDLLARRLLVLHGSEPTLRRSHLPDHMLRPTGRNESPGGEALPAPSVPESHADRRKRELAALLQGLRAHSGNVARAAASAGISRQRAYRLMEASRAEETRDEP